MRRDCPFFIQEFLDKDGSLTLQLKVIWSSDSSLISFHQLTMLENMFPRHILEFVMGASLPQANLGELAHQHEDVTILFMDIVGRLRSFEIATCFPCVPDH